MARCRCPIWVFPAGLARDERWAGRLARLLPDWEVIAEGHPGRTTVHDDPVEGAHRNGLTVLPALLESHRPVDVVLVMLGTNDLKERFSVNAGRHRASRWNGWCG